MFAEEVTLSTSDRQQCVCLVTALLIRQRGTGSGAARPCFRLLESLGASSPDEFIYVAASRGPVRVPSALWHTSFKGIDFRDGLNCMKPGSIRDQELCSWI